MKIVIAALLLVAPWAHADFKLANSGKKITCSGADNQTWEVNKARTKMKYTVEGESLGANKIINHETDGKTYVSYSSDEGTLTLGDKDTFQFAEEDQASEIKCN